MAAAWSKPAPEAVAELRELVPDLSEDRCRSLLSSNGGNLAAAADACLQKEGVTRLYVARGGAQPAAAPASPAFSQAAAAPSCAVSRSTAAAARTSASGQQQASTAGAGRLGSGKAAGSSHRQQYVRAPAGVKCCMRVLVPGCMLILPMP